MRSPLLPTPLISLVSAAPAARMADRPYVMRLRLPVMKRIAKRRRAPSPATQGEDKGSRLLCLDPLNPHILPGARSGEIG